MAKLQPHDAQVAVWVEKYPQKTALAVGLPDKLKGACIKVFHDWADVRNTTDTIRTDIVVLCPSRRTGAADLAKRIGWLEESCPEAIVIIYGRESCGDLTAAGKTIFVARRDLNSLVQVVRPRLPAVHAA
jgi:hypothetical protein